jgi:hypothetical protein
MAVLQLMRWRPDFAGVAFFVLIMAEILSPNGFTFLMLQFFEEPARAQPLKDGTRAEISLFYAEGETPVN